MMPPTVPVRVYATDETHIPLICLQCAQPIRTNGERRRVTLAEIRALRCDCGGRFYTGEPSVQRVFHKLPTEDETVPRRGRPPQSRRVGP
jgi:hypothetical protein